MWVAKAALAFQGLTSQIRDSKMPPASAVQQAATGVACAEMAATRPQEQQPLQTSELPARLEPRAAVEAAMAARTAEVEARLRPARKLLPMDWPSHMQLRRVATGERDQSA